MPNPKKPSTVLYDAFDRGFKHNKKAPFKEREMQAILSWIENVEFILDEQHERQERMEKEIGKLKLSKKDKGCCDGLTASESKMKHGVN
jgi:hypothetical protein